MNIKAWSNFMENGGHWSFRDERYNVYLDEDKYDNNEI
jgi:hypothetical protein